jgi:hypothetical protein
MKMPAPAARTHVLVISDRVYRLLLAAYPAEFRQRYGPEMVQVFRTCCRASYSGSGGVGVLRLWQLTIWDWICTMARERFSGLFRAKDTHAWSTLGKLVPVLFVLAALQVTICCYTGPGILAWPPLWVETCRFEVSNQSGETIRITPIDTSGRSPAAVRLYRASWPVLPAFRQRNIIVKPGDSVYLHTDCGQGVSELYACELEGECYIHQNHQFIVDHAQANDNVIFNGFMVKSLESLPRPEAALETAVQSFPEHDYSGLRNLLLCLVPFIVLFYGLYRLARQDT